MKSVASKKSDSGRDDITLIKMMADPMADMGPPKADSGLLEREPVDPLILNMNMARIERMRSVMAIASGCIAGIAGFTGLQGFRKSSAAVSCALRCCSSFVCLLTL